MKIPSMMHHHKYHLTTAFLLFWLAILLTSIGVTGWPILLYAAAPCYFLTFVLVIIHRVRKLRDRNRFEQTFGEGWF